MNIIESNNCCVMCGRIIPEGMMTCPICDARITKNINHNTTTTFCAEAGESVVINFASKSGDNWF